MHAKVEGVVAVIERHGLWLLIRRAEGVAAPGWWCFPGGAIEAGETQAEALVREIQEELGLVVQPVRQAWTWDRPDGGLRLYWWTAELAEENAVPVPNPGEVAEARWVSAVEIPDLQPLLPSTLAFLEAMRTDQGN